MNYYQQQVLARLPFGPQSATATAYIEKRYVPRKRAEQKAIVFNPEWTPEWDKHSKLRWVEQVSAGLRLVGKAHEVARAEHCARTIDHTGWFLDDDQNETVTGVVYRLPARAGQSCYVAGVLDPYNDDMAVIEFERYAEPMQAALVADNLANRYAEAARDSQRVDQAKIAVEDFTELIQTERSRCRALAKELRANKSKLGTLPELRAVLIREMKRVRETIASYQRRIRKAQEVIGNE